MVKNDPSFPGIWEELQWRGLIQVSTNTEELQTLLNGNPIVFYCGFDPTAPSLHLGNLVQLLTMRRLQLAGHKPLALVGGSTGLIGDPRPTAERTLNSKETVSNWVTQLQNQINQFLDFNSTENNVAEMVNNFDWTEPMNVLDFLRDIGKHFRVGTMLRKDAVHSRLNSDAGINFTEFSYQILQGMDFLELNRKKQCVLQTGGSDQWGNLTSGVELVHKAENRKVHAIGTPLVTNSDGTKFEKSEGNAIWLNPEMCTPFQMFQFWLNVEDTNVINLLKLFTFLTREEIEQLEETVKTEPFKRLAQKKLAQEVVTLVHGEEAFNKVSTVTEALFGKTNLTEVDPVTLETALKNHPNQTSVPAGSLLTDILVKTSLCTSISDARRAIKQKGISVDGAIVENEKFSLTPHMFNSFSIIRKGKKTFAGVFYEGDK